jgi:tellurite resistance protein TerB
MFGMFKKKAKLVSRQVTNFEKRDLMQAAVGIALLVGWADGDLSVSEGDKIQKVLANNPALKGFGGEVTETFNNYNTMLKDAGFLIGKSQIMREIEDVKGDNREAEDVFLVGLTIALADGTIDDKELKVLTDVGMMLGLRIENYLQV